MRRVLVIGVITLLVVTGVGVKARKQRTYAVYAEGVTSCFAWVENRKTSKEIDWEFKGQWILGWLSGASLYAAQLKETDKDAVYAWVDDYCTANSLKDLDEAARDLVEALRVK